MSLLDFAFGRVALDDDDPTVSFRWIRRAFGQGDAQQRGRGCSDARFTAFLDDLIGAHGFPRPLPAPKHGGGVEIAVTPRSQWLRAGVLEWFGDFLPPEAAASLEGAAAAAAADDMDAAAGNLRLVGGTEAA